MGQLGINGANSAGNHDGFVITPALTANSLLVFAEVASQIGTAKFVVEGGTAQGAFGHDLKGAGNVLRLSKITIKEFRDGKTA